MVERRQIPGVIRIRRRVLFRTRALLDWVDQKSAPLLKERSVMSVNIRSILAAAGTWTSTSCSPPGIGIANGAS